MLWAVITLLVLLGSLLLVCLVAGLRYIQLSRLQAAIEAAWFNRGHCVKLTEAECELHLQDDLDPPPQEVLKPEYDTKLARRLADYVCRMELVETTQTIADPPEHVQVGVFQPRVGPAFGVAWKYGGSTLVFAFRATVTHREIQDDLNAWQVNFDTGEKLQSPLTEDVAPDVTGEKAYVHSGFHQVYLRYRDEVRALVQEHQPQVILVCGHSLGGAVATLMTLDLAESFPARPLACYVFGTPRVGNEKFNERLRAALGSHQAMWRVVNKADTIQDLPLYVTPNLKRPHDRPFYYAHAGPSHEYYKNRGSWRTNHNMPNYVSYLQETLP